VSLFHPIRSRVLGCSFDLCCNGETALAASAHGGFLAHSAIENGRRILSLGIDCAAFANWRYSLFRASSRADFWKQPAGIAVGDRLVVVGRQALEGFQACNRRSDGYRRHERKIEAEQ
jgi:hypothetical protein